VSHPRSDAITVTVPARAEFLHLIRSVVASVAARRDLSIDAIEDLRLAVDEACASCCVEARPGRAISPTTTSGGATDGRMGAGRRRGSSGACRAGARAWSSTISGHDAPAHPIAVSKRPASRAPVTTSRAKDDEFRAARTRRPATSC
jgi:hypothetical protein